ncbi:MAG: DUF1080 domain-containing protein [Pirellulales bacterium]
MTIRQFCLLASLTVAFAFLPTFLFAQTTEEGWRPLFNEKNLDGWVLVNTPPDTWKVEDKMLICSGKPIGELRTDRMYQNFILEVEWRHMVPKGNAGIFVWADDITSKGVPFHRSIEVQVLENAYGNTQSHTTHGDIFPIHGATMKPVNGRGGSRAFPTEDRSKPSPEWNHYRIHCQDGRIALSVNGKQVTEGHECNPRKGYICIESEGGVVHYRNMRIRELPDTPVDASMVAQENRGFRSIYSGLDLRGWSTKKPSLWKVQDWELAYQGDATEIDSALFSEIIPSLQGFVLDARLQDDASQLELPFQDSQGPISTAHPLMMPHLVKKGSWNRLEGERTPEGWLLRVNGQIAVKSAQPATNAKPQIVLKPQGKVTFANVYVR